MPDPAGKSPPGSGVDRENMTKYCKKCDTTKPVSEFHKNAVSKDGLALYCRQCKNQMGKEWRKSNPDYKKDPNYLKEWRKNNPDKVKEWKKNNPDKVKEYARRGRPRQYGITIEDYNNLLDQQNNRCAICRGENEDGKALSIDHDHSCCKGKNSCGKCIRQLLCSHCNLILGLAKDNPEILEAAKKYLERHSRSKNLAKNLD